MTEDCAREGEGWLGMIRVLATLSRCYQATQWSFASLTLQHCIPLRLPPSVFITWVLRKVREGLRPTSNL